MCHVVVWRKGHLGMRMGGGARVHQHLFVNIVVVGSSIYSI